MENTASWKAWEGRVVDGKFPLRKWLGGSDHSAVFLTELGSQPGRRAAIKLVAARVTDDEQLSRWRSAAQKSHPHLMHVFETGRCEFDGNTLLFLVTEYAEEDLAQILPHRPLSPAETRAYCLLFSMLLLICTARVSSMVTSSLPISSRSITGSSSQRKAFPRSGFRPRVT